MQISLLLADIGQAEKYAADVRRPEYRLQDCSCAQDRSANKNIMMTCTVLSLPREKQRFLVLER